MQNSIDKKSLIVAGVMLFAAVGCVMAGQDNAEFSEVWDLLENWATGTLGKIIALAALIVGIGFGLVRQNVTAAVIGISMALVLNYGPTVISGIFTATAEHATAAQMMLMANGLM